MPMGTQTLPRLSHIITSLDTLKACLPIPKQGHTETYAHSGHSYMTTLNTPQLPETQRTQPLSTQQSHIPSSSHQRHTRPSAGPEAQLSDRAQPSTCEAMTSVVRDGKSP